MYASLIHFSSLVAAVVMEAAPFLLLGALISALMEQWLTPERAKRLVPRSPLAGAALGLAAGMALPTCECGVVPIVRRMLVQGVQPSAALTYMLAAPVINPVVLVSTWVAFQGDGTMVLMRAVFVAVPALAMGLALGRLRGADLLRANHAGSAHAKDCAPGCGCGHDHSRDHDSIRGPLLARVLARTGEEFLDMGQYLILGALAAAVFKTLLPAWLLGAVGKNLVVSVLVMMLLAVALSVCSEADAFVAASFASFPRAAQLSFVAVGPMVDLKLMAMYLAVFRRPVALALMLVPFASVLLLSLMWGLFGGPG